VKKLYPRGIFCSTCKKITKHHREAKRPAYKCQYCGHHEHPMRGTIFQDSATSLKLWFFAIRLMSATRCGISAKQLERELGVLGKRRYSASLNALVKLWLKSSRTPKPRRSFLTLRKEYCPKASSSR